MKNMKTAQKLIMGFLIVALLGVVVGVVGIIGMSQLSDSFSTMYDMQTVPMPYMTKIIEMVQRQRACLREMIVGASFRDDTSDPDHRNEGLALVQDAYDRIQDYRKTQEENEVLYRATILDPSALDIFDEAVSIYEEEFLECADRMYAGAMGDMPFSEVYDLMTEYTASINKVVEEFETILDMKIDTAAAANAAGDALFTSMLTLIIVVLAVAVAIAIFLAVYISGLISKPLAALSTYMERAGGTGNITFTPEEERVISTYGKNRDEVGQTILNTSKFINHVTSIAKELEAVANGDLTHTVKTIGNDDIMGNSLSLMIDNLNNMFSEINNATGQVATGAKQVADGAQSLAQGSTEQAASIEELSASIGDVASSTKANAEIAGKTAKLSGTIKENAEKGSRQMDDMINAVQDINEASLSISKIIKTIDDIAFQTNILALNAAVEAARAGQHGKGFAVVAEEVRNLASKSADAAKDTGDMIQNSMSKAELGSQIAGETAASLKEIVSGISESSELIAQIAQASEDQSLAISQINTGVDQVAQVVQQNSATAEQSAAASEQMSGQSTVLEDLIAQFKLREQGSGFKSLPSSRKESSPAADSSDSSDDFDVSGSDNFGKY